MEKGSKMIILVLLAGVILRLISLNQSFWMDEAISATVVKNFTPTEIVTKFIYSDTHPPLYYLILKFWSDIFGYSEVSLRAPSLIFGILTVYVLYLIAESLFSGKNIEYSLMASGLLATSGLHIYYSQEARMYALTTLLVSLGMFLFLKKRWILLSLVLLLLGMTDYLPLLILLPMWFYLIFKKENVINFLISHLPLALFLVFWFPVFKVQSMSTSAYLQVFPAWKTVLGSAGLKDLVLVWVKFIIGRVSLDNKLLYGLFAGIVAFLYLTIFCKALKEVGKSLFLWLWLLIPVTIAFLGAFFIPGFSYFRLTFVLPAFYLLLTQGVSRTKYYNLALTLLIFVNLSTSLLYLFNPKYQREDWKTAVPFIENKLTRGDVVLVSYTEPFTPYLWYSKKPERVFVFNPDIANRYDGIYTLDYLMDLTDPERNNYMVLNNMGFQEKEIYNFSGVGQIRYWAR